MPIALRDLLALLIAAGAAVAGLVVWEHGTVSLGMRLTEVDGQVRVADVTPDGNAARGGWYPDTRVLHLTTVDGSHVEVGPPLRDEVDAIDYPPEFREEAWLEEAYAFDPFSGEVLPIGPDHRPPVEAVESANIATAVNGEVAPDYPGVYAFSSLDRTLFELELRSSLWLAAMGVALGIAVWRLLAHGVGGRVGREHALIGGVAVAVPFLVLPVVEAGTTLGVVAGYLVPGAVALLLGLSLARQHPDRPWAQTAAAGSVVAAVLAVVLVARYMTAPTLGADHRGSSMLMIAATTVVPAFVAAMVEGRRLRERGAVVSLSLVPVAAGSVLGMPRPEPFLPVLLLTGLFAWQVLPLNRAFAAIGRRATAVSGPALAAGSPVARPTLAGVRAGTRDALSLGLLGSVVLAAFIAGGNPLPAIFGIGLAALAAFAVRRGFLGPRWTDAAIPLAVAIGTPVALNAFTWFGPPESWALAIVPTSLAALTVAHVLATRHTDPAWGARLLVASVGLVAVIAFLALVGMEALAFVLTALLPLLPGLPVAFAPSGDQADAATARLETLAVALTPAAAATMLIPPGAIILIAWLVAIVIWRNFTLAPLLRFAQRSQLQRDVAVTAAETERARLAADLHDDALQQLTMLVRTLEQDGQTDAAAEAREIATKLRSVVGDLRLPILDDLGAGAALEWLVERVEPLAGGPVKLERSDATRPPATVELAVFRVAQEALTNAIKHGKPPIEVRYDVRTDGRVTLAVDDAGEGIGSEAAKHAPGEGHFGLINMQQRAEQIGALLDVRRWPGGGTRVALEWRPQ